MNTATIKLKDMIAAGQYDEVSSLITEENFPMPENLVLGTEPKLFSYSEDVPEGTTFEEDLLARMDREGYRPANLWELLDYGYKNPKEQLVKPITALGSEYREHVAILCCRFSLKMGNPRRRFLDVTLNQGGLDVERFLGVRK
jgi:hypothetical protein